MKKEPAHMGSALFSYDVVKREAYTIKKEILEKFGIIVIIKSKFQNIA